MPPLLVNDAKVVACPFETVSPPFAVINPEDVNVPVMDVLFKISIKPEPEFKIIFPVVLPPRVRVCLLVVASVPVPVMYVALLPLFPEIEAVGVPVALFRNANFEEAVEVPPNRTSAVFENGDNAPEFSCQ